MPQTLTPLCIDFTLFALLWAHEVAVPPGGSVASQHVFGMASPPEADLPYLFIFNLSSHWSQVLCKYLLLKSTNNALCCISVV